MSILSDELWLYIFQHLDFGHLATCERVCRAWNRIACDKSLVRNLKYSTKKGISNEQLHRIGLKYRGSLRHIDLSCCWFITDHGVSQFAALVENLTYLDLSNCDTLTDAALSDISAYCPRLSTLILYGCSHVSDKGMDNLSGGCVELEILHLSGCQRVTDQGLQALCYHLPKLHSIDLTGTAVTDVGLLFLFHTQIGERLQSVYLNSCHRVTSQGVNVTATANPNLRILCLKFCRLQNNCVFSLRSVCANLTLLDLGACTDLTASFFVLIVGSFRNLTAFVVHDTKIDDEALSLLGVTAPHLQRLNINNCEAVTSFGLQKLVEGQPVCPLLKLNINSLPNVDDRGLLEVVTTATNLYYLECGALDVSEGALGTLLLRGQNLYELHACMNSFHDAMLQRSLSAGKGLPMLHTLDLSWTKGTDSISDVGAEVIAAACPALASLTIVGHPGIGRRGFRALMMSCPLTDLYIGGCAVTDEVLEDAADLLGGNLRSLGLRRCNLVTDDGVWYLAPRCPSLRSIDLSHTGTTLDSLRLLEQHCPLALDVCAAHLDDLE